MNSLLFPVALGTASPGNMKISNTWRGAGFLLCTHPFCKCSGCLDNLKQIKYPSISGYSIISVLYLDSDTPFFPSSLHWILAVIVSSWGNARFCLHFFFYQSCDNCLLLVLIITWGLWVINNWPGINLSRFSRMKSVPVVKGSREKVEQVQRKKQRKSTTKGWN